MNVIKYKANYYEQVKQIYENSFPQKEQYITLDKMIISENTKLYCLIDKKEVVGFIYLIFYKDMIFILYLAIDNKKRLNGYGSYLLKWCLEKYKNKKIYLNIEEVKVGFKDYNVRIKRLKFYQKNGFFLTNYVSMEKDENFNILSNNPEIDLYQYKKLDSIIAQILDEPISIIKCNI